MARTKSRSSGLRLEISFYSVFGNRGMHIIQETRRPGGSNRERKMRTTLFTQTSSDGRRKRFHERSLRKVSENKKLKGCTVL